MNMKSVVNLLFAQVNRFPYWSFIFSVIRECVKKCARCFDIEFMCDALKNLCDPFLTAKGMLLFGFPLRYLTIDRSDPKWKWMLAGELCVAIVIYECICL